jgi:NCS1 family nucleobase:cation symporter-1
MSNTERPSRLETSTIEPIPADQRHGKAADLFTVWFGSNLMLLTVVTGGLAVTVFALPFGWALAALVLGNLIGGVFMALHAAQGPTLGVPQMVQTRGQFGSVGSLLVVGIVIVMYLGFLASNLVVGGESLALLVGGMGEVPGILLVGILSVVAAVYGHDLIHAYTRVMSYLSGTVLLAAAVWIVWVHGLPRDFLDKNAFQLAGFLGTLSTAALWQIAYAPYVSDYSRYMPKETGARPAFWASYWGCVLGSLLPMILGAMVGLAAPRGSLVVGLAGLTGALAPVVLVVFTVGIAAATAMNLYCGALSTLTFGQTLRPQWAPGSRARAVVTLVLSGFALGAALLGKDSFMGAYEQFILLLLYVLVPWTAINLVDYYCLRHGDYDVAAFFLPDGGIYGRVNAVAVACYGLGILVQLPFVATALWTGPIAREMGGVDLSWVAGLAVTSPVYYLWAKHSRRRDEPRSDKTIAAGAEQFE